jgi:hypothetical protein
MMTSLAIDDKLLKEAQLMGRHRSKRETVTIALKEYISHKKQLEIVDLFGTIDYDPNYDYKKARNRK